VRALLTALAFLIVAAAPSRAADAMADFDEYDLHSFIILKCHAAQDDSDRAHLSKADAVRKVALDTLWAQLDKINPARHAENGKNAEATLARRSDAHDRFIQSQVTEYGCDWLDGKGIQQRQ
jgi:hypothetical protein